MGQETGDKKNPEERKTWILNKIRKRVSKGSSLSPALEEVLRKIGAESEIQAAIDAGREEGIEPTNQEIKRIKD